MIFSWIFQALPQIFDSTSQVITKLIGECCIGF